MKYHKPLFIPVTVGALTIVATILLYSLLSLEPAETPRLPELVVYTYESLNSKNGLGERIFPSFEKKCHCRLKVSVAGDAGQIVTRLQLDQERGETRAHIALGLDQYSWKRAQALLKGWGEWEPSAYSLVDESVKVGNGFLPYDYGIFAFMANLKLLRKEGLEVPTRFADLLHESWKKKIILQDPRTSTPGQGFLIYSYDLYGQKAWGFWKLLKDQWLTLASGWEAAYGMFRKGEAPLVWSYLTSEAYHRKKKQKHFRAVLFEEGQPIQVEGAALVAGDHWIPETTVLAREFLNHLLSEEIQVAVPETQFMFPVVPGVKLPAAFAKLPKVKKLLPPSQVDISELIKTWEIEIQ